MVLVLLSHLIQRESSTISASLSLSLCTLGAPILFLLPCHFYVVFSLPVSSGMGLGGIKEGSVWISKYYVETFVCTVNQLISHEKLHT